MLRERQRALFDKPRKAELLLLLVSAVIYFVYFHYIILNINSSMSSITNDTLKNYYTYAYQVKHGDSFLHFNGMNYPFGEHLVYTDCQPLLCWVLMPLEFAHDHAIGIMHALILISFVLTPLLLRRVLLRLSVEEAVAWPGALGLALLSPQFLKMNAGHFALSYTFVIPLGMLLILRFIGGLRPGALALLIIYVLLLFFLHPYLGFGLAIFTFMTLLAFSFFSPEKKKIALSALFAGILPVLVFKVFMLLTDHHPGRTPEPYGLDVMVENSGSLLAPEFGPFKSLMEGVTPQRTGHFEGHTYLGFATILLLLLLPVVLLVKRRPYPKQTITGNVTHNTKPETRNMERANSWLTFSLLLASLVLLFFAFGWHLPLMKALGIKSASLSQFRAVCRFAWFFYYALGIFLISYMSRLIRNKQVLFIGAVIYLLFCFIEAHFFFRHDKHAFWNWRNLFNKEQLTEEERQVLASIDTIKPQALIPLPLFHGGTELYDRPGSHTAMIPSMLYSYHSGLPLVSMLASRTSIPETEEVLSLINTYKKTSLPAGTSASPFLVLKTTGPYLPDEERLWSRASLIKSADSVDYAVIDARQLRIPIMDTPVQVIDSKTTFINDTVNGIYYERTGNFRAFTRGNTKDMEFVMSIRKNQFPAGRYILSIHFHYHDRTWRSLACGLVLTRDQEDGGEWLSNTGLKTLSGFYDGFGVTETYIDLEKDKGYNLVIYGNGETPYRVSDLMIRPVGVSVMSADSASINNYPRGDL